MTDSRIVTLLRFEYRSTAIFAIADPDPAGAVDLPISVDSSGAPWIPPTAVAGSLRSHLTGTLDPEAVSRLMGSEPPGDSEDEAIRSRLQVNGTELAGAHRTVRLQTSVDRVSGSARAGSLRTVEALCEGAQLVIFMTVDGRLSDDERVALAGWTPVLGRARSRGMGTFAPIDLRMGILDLADPMDLRRWIGEGGPELHDTATTEILEPESGSRRDSIFRVHMRVADGLFSFDSSDGNTAASRTSIPGSSVKGVFRSRVEFILRSIGEPACEAAECGQCVACDMFGYANTDGARRSRIAFKDAPISLDDAPLEPEQLDSRMHVAIDRVTGGASRNRLFEERFVPHGATFDIVVDPLGVDPPSWVRDLLLWVVKDLHDSHVGVGGRTTRGFGTVCVAEAEHDPSYLDPSSLDDLLPVDSIVASREVDSE